MLFGRHRKLLILTYHRVPPEPDPLFPEQVYADSFAGQLACLKRFFNVLPLATACQALQHNQLPNRAVCITFDDGYRDNHDVALPLLRKYDLPATFFVASGFLGNGRMWNDTIIEFVRRSANDAIDLNAIGLGQLTIATDSEKRHAINHIILTLKHLSPHDRAAAVSAVCESGEAELPDDLMMTEDNVRALAAAGMEVGGHTVNHPILAKTPYEEAEEEIRSGKEFLERLTGSPVVAFAYPNGRPGVDYDESHVDLVRRLGFKAAVATSPGAASRDSDFFQLNRISVWNQKKWKYSLRLLSML